MRIFEDDVWKVEVTLLFRGSGEEIVRQKVKNFMRAATDVSEGLATEAMGYHVDRPRPAKEEDIHG